MKFDTQAMFIAVPDGFCDPMPEVLDYIDPLKEWAKNPSEIPPDGYEWCYDEPCPFHSPSGRCKRCVDHNGYIPYLAEIEKNDQKE